MYFEPSSKQKGAKKELKLKQDCGSLNYYYVAHYILRSALGANLAKSRPDFNATLLPNPHCGVAQEDYPTN